jgi:DNA adenine methylase
MGGSIVRPFLKFAGNKFKIIDYINNELPSGKRLIEPFVGSGAVFANTTYPEYWLNDNNQDLMRIYEVLKSSYGTAFISSVKDTYFIDEHFDSNSKEQYLILRELFNSTGNDLLKAGLFLYLNRHCYNGLIRYNKSGEFNVPFGSYKTVYFPEEELKFYEEKLKQAKLTCLDFAEVMLESEPGDVIYCDPPYAPLSKTANFTSYGAEGFSWDDQLRLADVAEYVAKNNGAFVLLSNHDTPDVREMYYKATTIHTLTVSRTISCKGSERKPVNELLIAFRPNQ